MVTLSLLRHAKSAWDNQGLKDFERPLAPRGVKAAPRMGQYIEKRGLIPDVVICSIAVRARETIELALMKRSAETEISFTDALYHAGPADMLELVHALDASCVHAMLTGHNPGMHELAMALAASGERAGMDAMNTKFPTAALAIIDFEGGWRDVAPGAGILRLFVTPRSLGNS